MSGQRRLRRRWAASMLLVWLFALASVVVNACVGTVAARPAQPLPTFVAVAAEATAGEVSLSGCMDHENGPAMSACLKFCDDESTGVAGVKTVASPQAAAALAAWPTLALALQAACDPLDLPRAEPAPPPATVSVPIAFLRLTL